MAFEGTELSEAIKAVRAGLQEAQREWPTPHIRFQVKEVVLDFVIEIRRTSAASGGVKAFVVSADARRERSLGQTHRMTVTLNTDGPVTVGDHGEVGEDPTRRERPFS
ncbi:trypco2 family protein [Streptomyces sp. NPDC059070]|uniref:trypco2 family protein n=1 Tax=unclassified Streptomyces TaxID=2593676 RepID=UPI0034E1B1A9